ncbi:MAG: c-type cytochrome [Gallionella sp.]
MKARYLFAIAASLSVSTTAFAAGEAEAVFNQSNCSMCHAAASASVGPSLKTIAAKYAKDDGAQAQLEKKVRSGGAGSFGTMPMPATPKSVSDESIKAMVRWILSQK